MLAAVRGYKTVFTMPDKVSQEKRALLRAFGAEVVVTPTEVPPDSPEHYVNVARRLSGEIEGSYMPNQYAEPREPAGPLHDDRAGGMGADGGRRWKRSSRASGPVGPSPGPGGTSRRRSRTVRVVGIEPEGSIYHNKKYGTDYPLHTVPGGRDRRGLCPRDVRPERRRRGDPGVDSEAFGTALRLTREEGIFAGGSSGAAVAGALKFAEKNPGLDQVVVILPDTGTGLPQQVLRRGLAQVERPELGLSCP